MRLVIDMQGTQTASRHRGIGRYTAAFVHAVIRARRNHEVVLSVNGAMQDSAAEVRDQFGTFLEKTAISAWYPPGPTRAASVAHDCTRRAWACQVRSDSIALTHPDILHVTSVFEGYGDDAICTPLANRQELIQTATFYDAIPLLFPTDYLEDPVFAAFYNRLVHELSAFDHLLAISESVRQEAIGCIGIPVENVTTVGAGVNDFFKPDQSSSLQNLADLGIRAKYILYAGGYDKRKNLRRLLEAYRLLHPDLRAEVHLVLVGMCHDSIVNELRSHARDIGIPNNQLVTPGYVTDDVLRQLYSQCDLSILPSLHEGFGLPLIEAMQCGAVVIGSNTSSIREIIADNSSLFDPYSVGDIARVLESHLLQPVLRDANLARGRVTVANHSWDRCAQKAWECWESLYARQQSRRERTVPIVTPSLFSPATYTCLEDNSIDVDDLTSLAVSIARSDYRRPRGARRQLFVDISELSQRDAMTGVQRVTRAILLHLLQLPQIEFDVIPVYATTSDMGYRYATAFTRRAYGIGDAEHDDELIEPIPGDYFLGLDLQHHVVVSQYNWLEWAYAHGVNIWFVVYDLLPLHFPDCFPPGTEPGHRDWLSLVLSFDGVTCISRTVASEVTEWLRTNRSRRLTTPRIASFPLGSDIANSAPSSGVPAGYEGYLQQWSQCTTLLMVGTLEPRKGHGDVLDALDVMWSRGSQLTLLIVGKPGWQVDSLIDRIRTHPQYGRQLFWLDHASDELLEILYDVADALLAFSRGEGFGLPLIEAAHHELPIIARDIAVFREVAGHYATYIDSHTPVQLAARLDEWLRRYRIGDVPSSAGLPLCTWDDSARELMKSIGLGTAASGSSAMHGNPI